MGKVRTAIIPVAGLGTRLLTATKEQPKEILPLFSKGTNGEVILKPVVQLVYEQLFNFGIREFCFVVGRGKRAIEDHFTPDSSFLKLLKERNKHAQVGELAHFYSMINESKIAWVNQPRPLGFGHAVLICSSFCRDDLFIVHAGDNYVQSKNNDFLRRMIDVQEKTQSDAVILLRYVPDPRKYGVAELEEKGTVYYVTEVVEKPEKPKSNFALLPVYVFKQSIFDSLKKVKAGKDGEIQLTDGIQGLIDEGHKVTAIMLNEDEYWLDVGTPQTYWEALSKSYASTG